MRDGFGRTIDYMRISLTHRCNLRCRYCMPQGVAPAAREDILRDEELLRLCRLAVSLGIVKFKVTGGEPLARRGCAAFIARLKAVPGVEQVTITTNGQLLGQELDALCAAGIDGINISLDTLDEGEYAALAGVAGASPRPVLEALEACGARGINTKVNAVLLAGTVGQLEVLAGLAGTLPVDVRFIELMPIGAGGGMAGISMEAALARLRVRWPDLQPVEERRGNGPARYYAGGALQGRIGFIPAVSRAFCADCNRVRLTAAGRLKPCLCFEEGADLRAPLRAGAEDGALRELLRECVAAKPAAHCFSRRQAITERRAMHQIGG